MENSLTNVVPLFLNLLPWIICLAECCAHTGGGQGKQQSGSHRLGAFLPSSTCSCFLIPSSISTQQEEANELAGEVERPFFPEDAPLVEQSVDAGYGGNMTADTTLDNRMAQQAQEEEEPARSKSKKAKMLLDRRAVDLPELDALENEEDKEEDQVPEDDSALVSGIGGGVLFACSLTGSWLNFYLASHVRQEPLEAGARPRHFTKRTRRVSLLYLRAKSRPDWGC